jgi:hypothetical protein
LEAAREGGGRREEVVSFYGTFSSYIKQTGLYQIIVDTDLNLFLLKKKKLDMYIVQLGHFAKHT